MRKLLLILLFLPSISRGQNYIYNTKHQADSLHRQVLDTAQAHIDTVAANYRIFVNSLLPAYLKTADTTGMLNPYLRKATATATYYPLTNPNGFISSYTETDPLSLHLVDTNTAFNKIRAQIPTNNNQLANGAGYLTSASIAGKVNYTDSLTKYATPQNVKDSANSVRAAIPAIARASISATGTISYNTTTGVISGGGTGTVTSVNPANGYAVTSSVTNATTTPVLTFGADSALLATRLRLQKVIDSLGAIISTKGTGTVTSTGTLNIVQKSTGTNTIGNSLTYDNGTLIGVNTTNPAYPYEILNSNASYATALSLLSTGDNARPGLRQNCLRATAGGAAFSLVEGYAGLNGSGVTTMGALVGLYSNVNSGTTPATTQYMYFGAATNSAFNNNNFRIYPNNSLFITSTTGTPATTTGGVTMYADANGGLVTISTSSVTGTAVNFKNSTGTTVLSADNSGGLKTSAPSGGTAAAILIGSVVTGTGGTNKYLMISSAGTVYYMPLFATLPN